MNSEVPRKPMPVHSSSDDLATKRTDYASHRTMMADMRSYMANERTHLAYLRTALSLMSFGITLNRFSIYLRKGEVAPISVPGILHQTEFIGLGIVVLGIVILCWSFFRYRQVNSAIKNDKYKTSAKALGLLTIGIIILGGVASLWMLLDWK